MNTKIENIINWVERINNMRDLVNLSSIKVSVIPLANETSICIESETTGECLLEEIYNHNDSWIGRSDEVLSDLEGETKLQIMNKKYLLENELKLLEVTLNNNP